MEIKMTTQDRITHHLKELQKACDEAAVERLAMVPMRHYQNLEKCVNRCADMIEDLANHLTLQDKELRDDARIYLGILRDMIHTGDVRPSIPVDDQIKANMKRQNDEYEMSRPKRVKNPPKAKPAKKGSKK